MNWEQPILDGLSQEEYDAFQLNVRKFYDLFDGGPDYEKLPEGDRPGEYWDNLNQEELELWELEEE